MIVRFIANNVLTFSRICISAIQSSHLFVSLAILVDCGHVPKMIIVKIGH